MTPQPARQLPPEKALDTPLSPPPLNREPGPAAGLSGDYPDGIPPAGTVRFSGRNLSRTYP